MRFKILLTLIVTLIVTTAKAQNGPWYTPWTIYECQDIEPAIPPTTQQDDCVVNIPTNIAPDDPVECRQLCIACYQWCSLTYGILPARPLFIVDQQTGISSCDCFGSDTFAPLQTVGSATKETGLIALVLCLLVLLLFT